MKLRTWAAVVIPVAIFLAHASTLGAWIVDDAGISFAYARSLATGHGLVAQVGAPPVEGFTNLLWVILLSGAMRLGLFDPVWTPKVLAACCVALSFLLANRLLTGAGERPAWIAGASASMTAGITGFAVWSISGLENALYAVLLQTLAVVLAADASLLAARGKLAVRSALLLFLVLCTRPDGALYFWLPPFVLGWGAASAREPAAGERGRRSPWVLYVTLFAGLWALLTVFRAAYFQDVLPNTFYAKKGEGAWFFAGLLSCLSPLAAAAVVVILGAGAMLAVGWGCHAAGRRLGRARSSSLFARHASIPFLLTAMVVYAALPGDWMGEYRFATPVFLFGPVALLGIVHDLGSRPGAPRAARRGVGAALRGAPALHARFHTEAFASRPTISLDEVRGLTTKIAAELAPLGRRATVLTPDIGGALWEDRFQVIDYVGLVDQRLGRVVGRDPRLLRDHILDVRRPDGIWLHSNWLRELALEGDERFRRDYAPAWEQRPEGGGPPVAGFYLRRDAGVLIKRPG